MERDEEKLNEALIKLEYLKRELEDNINTLNILQYTQESVGKSLIGLDSLKEAEKEDIMIPYSSDIFFSGKILNTDSAIVSLGNNIFKKVDIKTLKDKLTKDFNELNKNIETLANTINNLQEEGEKLEAEINTIYQRLDKGTEKG